MGEAAFFARDLCGTRESNAAFIVGVYARYCNVLTSRFGTGLLPFQVMETRGVTPRLPHDWRNGTG
jgi:hypothetical protein